MKNKTIIAITSIILVLTLASGIGYWFYLRKAHSTFENYYAFRGCVQLISTTTDSGTCQTGSGQIIKIVEYQGKWYLDGDLPWACLGKVCFGI